MRFSAATVLAIAPLALAINPKGIVGAPRRSDASPNPSGEWAVFSETLYDWDGHAASSSWKLINIASGDITTLSNSSDINELFWTGPTDTSILYINATNEETPGGVTMYIADATSFDDATLVGSLDAPFQGLKATKTPSGDITFVVNTLTYPNGTAYNPEAVVEPLSSAEIYTDTYVRHWDTWLTPQRYSIFSGTLKASNSSGSYPTSNSSSSYTFDGKVSNLLMGIDAPVTRPETPVQPFGDQGDYDISPDGSKVAFLTKAPEKSKQNYTTSYIYVVPSDGSSTAVSINGPGKAPKGVEGASGAPRWSPDSKYLAYFQMDDEIYESDRNKIYIATIGDSANSTTIKPLVSEWDRSPDLLGWSPKGKSLVVGAPDVGSEKIFVVPINATSDFKPKNITHGISAGGSVASFYSLPDSTLLVSDSAIWNSRSFYTQPETGGNYNVLFSANKVDEQLSGLTPADVSEFYYPGNFTDIQSFIVYPEGFDESKKYPLAFLIHGGPQVAWLNSWSTRWNPKTWADQGYVVIMPNPTGSNSFGQHLEDMIQNNWGSYPYDDLVKGWEYVRDNFDFIDTDNGIAAGASYGGYMVNWIQGHDLGRKFKALVTHDGVTSTLNQYASEELWFMQHDFNGTLWEDKPNYERWNPVDYASEWATPHFVVHNALDYRLPESEGVMLFNILQERGVPSRMLHFPDESHWVLQRENSLVWHTEIYNWINHYTGLTNTQAIDTEQYVGSG